MTEKRIVISLSTKQAERNAKALDQDVKGIGKSADKTQFSLSKMAIAIGAVTAAIGVGSALLLSNQRNFDKLNASLITATGSAEKAAIAFQAIQNLAATTPYSVEQVTEAFVKLKNLGLDPSEKAIISYGNTAAALGKDLNQMIEAVADASTFEFERLKEFGIKAKQQGDQVSFTFQGITTTVNKSATEIENYLKSIGDVNFAGAMEARAKTLDGAISNLSDSVDALLLAINQAGIGEAFGEIVSAISGGVREITATIKSGELQADFAAIGTFLQPTIKGVQSSVNLIIDKINELGPASVEVAGLLGFTFKKLVSDIQGLAQIVGVEVGNLVAHYRLYSEGRDAIEKASTAEQRKAIKEDYDARLAALEGLRIDSIDEILKTNAGSIDAMKKGFDDAKKLRDKYDEEQRKSALNNNVLGQFGIAPSGAVPVDAKKSGKAADARDEAGDKLRNEKNNTDILRAELETRTLISQQALDAQYNYQLSGYQREILAIQDQEALKLAELQKSYESENRIRQAQRDSELEFYAKNKLDDSALRDEFLTQDAIIAQTHEEQLFAIRQQGVNARAELDRAEYQARLDSVGRLGEALIALGQGQSKKIFKIGQTLALAQAAVALPTAVMESFKNGGGYPWGLIPAAAMLATGLKNIQQIKSAGGSLGGGGGGSVPTPSLGGGSMGSGPSIQSTSSSTETFKQKQVIEVRGISADSLITGAQLVDIMQRDDSVVVALNGAQQDAQRRGVI